MIGFRQRLPILMYHNVSDKIIKNKPLNTAVENLEKQFKFLHDNGYKTYHFSELKALSTIAKKAVIITFDDGYVNQLKYAYPLLKKYQLKASLFVPLAYIGKKDSWNTNAEDIMNIAQLEQMDSKLIELGYHSFYHKKYHELTLSEVSEDFNKCEDFIKASKLNMEAVLAYPYGKFPRKNPEKQAFFKVLNQHKIKTALRIGNKVNPFPFKQAYEIQRIEINDENVFNFRLKLRFGKLF